MHRTNNLITDIVFVKDLENYPTTDDWNLGWHQKLLIPFTLTMLWANLN